MTKRLATALIIIVLSSIGMAPTAQTQDCQLLFDGTSDRVEVDYVPSLPDSIYSISAWVVSENLAISTIIARGEDAATDIIPWGLGVWNDGLLYLQIESGAVSGDVLFSNSPIANGVLTHIAVTRDSYGEVVFYINGAEDNRISNTVNPGGTSHWGIQIGFERAAYGQGSGGQDPGNFFKGSLDEIMLWNRPLTDIEVLAVFNSGIPADSTGLLGYWKFDEGTGQVLVDDSPSGNLSGVLGLSTLVESEDPQWSCDAADVHGDLAHILELGAAFPNPFNPQTTIAFDLPRQTAVTLRVFDVSGRLVRELIGGAIIAEGHNEIVWDGRDDSGQRVSSGTYLYNLEAGDYSETKRMALVK